jgi:hypothetical protein
VALLLASGKKSNGCASALMTVKAAISQRSRSDQ